MIGNFLQTGNTVTAITDSILSLSANEKSITIATLFKPPNKIEIIQKLADKRVQKSQPDKIPIDLEEAHDQLIRRI